MQSSHTSPALNTAAVTSAVLVLLGATLPAAVTVDTDSELSRFYRQRITWSACEGADMPRDLQCGKVTVPLDYDRPGDGTLELAMARYRATGTSRARCC